MPRPPIACLYVSLIQEAITVAKYRNNLVFQLCFVDDGAGAWLTHPDPKINTKHWSLFTMEMNSHAQNQARRLFSWTSPSPPPIMAQLSPASMKNHSPSTYISQQHQHTHLGYLKAWFLGKFFAFSASVLLPQISNDI